MILKCDEKWESRILDYISKDYSKCLYIYMDIKKYGFKHKDINIWVDLDLDSKIKAVIFTYHNGMHIYSKDLNGDWEEISKLIMERKPSIICAVSYIVKQLSEYIFECYKSTYGVVKNMSQFQKESSHRVKKAGEQDIEQMAQMLSKNSNDGYTLEERRLQLHERLNDGFSRSCVIYDNDRIIAQASTNAEVDDVAIIAGVKVDDDYRRQGLATELVKDLCSQLIDEGKAIYLVCYNDIADCMYEKLGFTTCEQWAKLVLI